MTGRTPAALLAFLTVLHTVLPTPSLTHGAVPKVVQHWPRAMWIVVGRYTLLQMFGATSCFWRGGGRLLDGQGGNMG